MSDLNNFTIVGRLTKPIEVQETQSGTEVAKFSIAVNEKYGKVEHTSFFNCVSFGKQAGILSKYVSKGDRIALSGKLKQNRWESKTGEKRQGVDLIIRDFMFLSNKSESSQESTPDLPESNPFSDSDIPF